MKLFFIGALLAATSTFATEALPVEIRYSSYLEWYRLSNKAGVDTSTSECIQNTLAYDVKQKQYVRTISKYSEVATTMTSVSGNTFRIMSQSKTSDGFRTEFESTTTVVENSFVRESLVRNYAEDGTANEVKFTSEGELKDGKQVFTKRTKNGVAQPLIPEGTEKWIPTNSEQTSGYSVFIAENPNFQRDLQIKDIVSVTVRTEEVCRVEITRK